MPNPIRPSIKSEIVPILMILISIAASFYFYANFPERVPSHWGIDGEVNGWSSRGFGAFFMPILLIAMYALFLTIPYLDPKRERYDQFRKPYHIFKAMIIVIMFAIYIFTSLAALGYAVNITLWITLLIGLLFIVLGNYMGKIKMNWFMGIRTPWTLSSETVWNKTHRLGGKLFMLSGVVFIFMNWLPTLWRMISFIAVMIILVFGTMVYSYYLYRQEKKKYDGNNIEFPKSEN